MGQKRMLCDDIALIAQKVGTDAASSPTLQGNTMKQETKFVTIRIPLEILEKLRQQAAENQRSLSGQIVNICKKATEK